MYEYGIAIYFRRRQKRESGHKKIRFAKERKTFRRKQNRNRVPENKLVSFNAILRNIDGMFFFVLL